MLGEADEETHQAAAVHVDRGDASRTEAGVRLARVVEGDDVHRARLGAPTEIRVASHEVAARRAWDDAMAADLRVLDRQHPAGAKGGVQVSVAPEANGDEDVEETIGDLEPLGRDQHVAVVLDDNAPRRRLVHGVAERRLGHGRHTRRAEAGIRLAAFVEAGDQDVFTGPAQPHADPM